MLILSHAMFYMSTRVCPIAAHEYQGQSFVARLVGSTIVQGLMQLSP
jgi:hypothetical protein